MIVDLPVEQFCRSNDIGEFTGIDFPATRSSFRMFKLADGWVDMEKLFPIAAGMQTCRALFATYAPHKYAEYYSDEFASQLKRHAKADYDNAFILGGVANYWHFLIDHLAKLPLLRYFQAPPSAIVVSDRLSPDFQRLLERACVFVGTANPVLTRDSRPILRIRNSFVPCVNDIGPRLRFLRDFGRALQATRSAASAQRLFFRRGNATQRRVTNEGELEEALAREFGFVAVDPGAMSTFEQITLVKDAKIIVGGHGAALTNAIFAPSLIGLVELFAGQKQPFLRSMCAHLGMGHHFVQGEPVDAHAPVDQLSRMDNQDYSIKPDELLTLVASLAQLPKLADAGRI